MPVDTLNHQIRHHVVRPKLHGLTDNTVRGGFIYTDVEIDLTRADVSEQIQCIEAEWESKCIQKERGDISNFVHENLL